MLKATVQVFYYPFVASGCMMTVYIDVQVERCRVNGSTAKLPFCECCPIKKPLTGFFYNTLV